MEAADGGLHKPNAYVSLREAKDLMFEDQNALSRSSVVSQTAYSGACEIHSPEFLLSFD